MKYCYCDTPIGKLLLAGDGDGLRLVSFPKGSTRKQPRDGWEEDPAPFQEVIEEIRQYFSGQRRRFSIKLRLQGTPFQKKVWDALRKVPYGATVSYGELARRAGNPKAARAVGMANHRNPIPIIIPCHRVIGKNGSLTGFGGGLEVKQKLLDLEKRNK